MHLPPPTPTHKGHPLFPTNHPLKIKVLSSLPPFWEFGRRFNPPPPVSPRRKGMVYMEKWNRAVANGKAFAPLLTDLLKVFDCLSHELLLARLHAHSFRFAALRLIHSYLTIRKQRTKANSSYSSWKELVFGVPQGSILRPLLFNIFLCDMFFAMKDIDFASYTNDNASQFNYCPLVWMCHHRSVNNERNRFHERCLRTVYSDSVSSFEELLHKIKVSQCMWKILIEMQQKCLRYQINWRSH